MIPAPAPRANGSTFAAEQVPFRQAPHNLEAEQALLGAILMSNGALGRVSSFLEPAHFFDPLHQQIYETAAKEIEAGKLVTPITLRTFFETAAPISAGLTVPQYLGTLAANATTIINAEDYGRTIHDLATRRALIIIGEDMVNGAYDSPVDASPSEQLDDLHGRIDKLRSECSRESLSVSRCLADVEAQPIRWLWPERIARGKLNLLAGVPDLGKSQVTCAFAAAVTTGGPWPDGTTAPLGSVIFITCEDDASDTIRPRLEAAGADLRRVHLLDWAVGRTAKGKRELLHFDVKKHGAALADLIRSLGDVRLIIIDPITAHLGRTDSHVTAEVRAALAPLQTLAAETGTAIVLISHLNKGTSGDNSAMNRITGSGAFTAVCRSAWLIAPDPKDPEKRRRILVPIKNNLSADKSGFAYTIEGATLPDGISTSHVVFDPIKVTVTADELLQEATPAAQERKSAVEKACEFLRNQLSKGSIPSKELDDARKAHEIAPATLKRARERLGIVAEKGSDGTWRASLPPEAPQGGQRYQECQEYQELGGS